MYRQKSEFPLPDKPLVPVQAQAENGWLAKLDISFQASSTPSAPTRLNFKHAGPLRIQKALYPEGPGCCHAILIHPPGGIASGDRLELNVQSNASTHGLLTTPSATKWYGADGEHVASQSIRMELNGCIEWLPMETIVFDHARVTSDISISASAQARMIGWDQLIFGRKSSGESFTEGFFKQSLRIEIDGILVWHDKLSLQGSDALFSSPIGLRGNHSLASVWALRAENEHWTDEILDSLRESTPKLAWTRIHPRLLVGRLLAEPLELKAGLIKAWKVLRPLVTGAAAVEPRLWAT